MNHTALTGNRCVSRLQNWSLHRSAPSTLPDMLSLAKAGDAERTWEHEHARAIGSKTCWKALMPGDLDIGIAMSIQTLKDLANQSGLFRDTPPDTCRRQLQNMARICQTS